MIGLENVFDKEEFNIKIIKFLDRSWQPKVTIVLESKDLSTMTTTSLFNKLKEHELEMNGLNVQESSDKKIKMITLKFVDHRTKISEEESNGCSDFQTLNMFTIKFGKFLKKERLKTKKISYSFRKPKSNLQILIALVVVSKII